jgi:hypothetical protein
MRVLRPFYLNGDTVAAVGQVVQVPATAVGDILWAGRAELVHADDMGEVSAALDAENRRNHLAGRHLLPQLAR